MENKYWEKKLEKIVYISKKYGFPEQNLEFWRTQPAGVISLIVKIDDVNFNLLNAYIGK